MALLMVCDGGCGKSGDPSAFVTLGVVIKRQYCETCAVAARNFIAVRDRAHEAAAYTWRDRLAGAIAGALALHPDMQLPDVAKLSDAAEEPADG